MYLLNYHYNLLKLLPKYSVVEKGNISVILNVFLPSYSHFSMLALNSTTELKQKNTSLGFCQRTKWPALSNLGMKTFLIFHFPSPETLWISSRHQKRTHKNLLLNALWNPKRDQTMRNCLKVCKKLEDECLYFRNSLATSWSSSQSLFGSVGNLQSRYPYKKIYESRMPLL